MSQWSLTFEVRKRRAIWDASQQGSGESQWSLTFEVRKRMTAMRAAVITARSSQWSLTFEVRKRRRDEVADDDGLVVAMEPDL